TALAAEAVLAALDAYITAGGGSRGARAILAPDGECAPSARALSLEAYRFKQERKQDRAEQILVRREGDSFRIRRRPLRTLDPAEKPFFERDWPDYLTGAIYNTREPN
ncbi:MAG: oxidoreductase, partial [Pseudomonadota bacterium]|nr:oxidoreductase [Pseudomonadota bacterium]